MSKTKIICTIGPSSLKQDLLGKLKERNVDFFRVNLSHTNEEDVEKIVIELKKSGMPIILDTEGCQVRTANLSEVSFKEGGIIKIFNKKVICDSNNFFLNPEGVIKNLRSGDLISLDFNSVLLKVFDTSNLRKEGYIECFVLIGGLVGGRKAVYIDSPTFKLPPFSKKDHAAVEIAKKHGVSHFTLSFMESANDVKYFRKIFPTCTVFSKIESKNGLKNFIEIAKESDGVLIDRGDLSHQVPLERIPLIQKYIISQVRALGKEVFVATNTLEQMAYTLKPNRAEVNDIINTLLDGATGIALTKETAVGKYPVETVNMLNTLIDQLNYLKLDSKSSKKQILESVDSKNYLYSSGNVPGLVARPHGGKLVDRMIKGDYNSKLPHKKIIISEEELMDVEQIAIGSFSPIEGFMGKEDFYSVLKNMRLANNTIWPMPIFLAVSQLEANTINEGDSVSLTYGGDNLVYAILRVEEKFKIDKIKVAKEFFGTNDESHPGVKKLISGDDICLGGKITLIKRRNSPYQLHELTPLQVRKIFSERGWSKVIGFHTRNVAHKGHEFVQMEGLSRSSCDGILIHPIIGKKKEGDFEAEVIIETYEKLINLAYNSRALLSAFASYSRYAGPREALFTALVRKNFGCTHFIVGRDHTGVGSFYAPDASHKIFDKFNPEELGIIPVKFDKVFYSNIEKKYLHQPEAKNHPEKEKLEISGTQAREMLKSGRSPPAWFMRPEVTTIILRKIKSGKKVFC